MKTVNISASEKDIVPNAAASRSAIPSPYFDLGASVAVAQAVYSQYGGVCSPDQLAAALEYKSTASGTYLTRIAAANKHFGLIDVTGDKITVTERAKKILAPVMPEDAVGAKVEAFLAVQLFNRVYEDFKGGQLPPEIGIKNLFQNKYGVLPDRIAQAMRVFFNSAEQAGFFAATGNRTRLIKPSLTSAPVPVGETQTPVPPSPPAPSPAPRPPMYGGGGSDGTGAVHSAIIGLLRDLPPPGAGWPKKQKARFIKAFQATLDFVYPGDDEDDEGGLA